MTATILVLDDVQANVILLEKKLISAYYTVLTANSNKEAFAILSQQKVDLILLDFMTIKSNLFSFCKQIKDDPQTVYIPIVIMTTQSGIGDRIKGFEAGVADFLTKPVNDIELFARIDSLTRLKSVIDELTLRNQTNAQLGDNIVHIQEDFKKSKIIIIDNDLSQSQYIANIVQGCAGHIKICTNPQDIDNMLQSFIPDLFIISCEMENIDPLTISASLRAKAELQHSFIVLRADKKHDNIIIKGIEIGINDYFITGCNKYEMIARITNQLRHKIYIDHLIHNLEQNANDAIKDRLTNIFNRRYFDHHMQFMLEDPRKAKRDLTLVMIDVDHFKEINDNFGHQTGDIVLQELARIFQNHLRITDIVARYGGDEFVILINRTSTIESHKIVDRIRQAVTEHKFYTPTTDSNIEVSISCGMSQYKGGLIASCLREADTALYEAKDKGRNIVMEYKA